jgi:hypothetical protein
MIRAREAGWDAGFPNTNSSYGPGQHAPERRRIAAGHVPRLRHRVILNVDSTRTNCSCASSGRALRARSGAVGAAVLLKWKRSPSAFRSQPSVRCAAFGAGGD